MAWLVQENRYFQSTFAQEILLKVLMRKIADSIDLLKFTKIMRPTLRHSTLKFYEKPSS